MRGVCGRIVSDAGEFFRRGNFVFDELIEDEASFTPAANHAEEGEGPVNPVGQHQRVALMAARENEAEGGSAGRRLLEQFLPVADAKPGRLGKILRTGERGPIVEHRDREIQRPGQRRDCLRDVPGAGKPQRARRRHGFLVQPRADQVFAEGGSKVTLHPPRP